ncbi:hypothetical protein ABFX02_08G186900 [Erythranthe guttata]
MSIEEDKCKRCTCCGICHEDFTGESRVTHFRRCIHLLHEKCYDGMLENMDLEEYPCPSCRVTLDYMSSFMYITGHEESAPREEENEPDEEENAPREEENAPREEENAPDEEDNAPEEEEENAPVDEEEYDENEGNREVAALVQDLRRSVPEELIDLFDAVFIEGDDAENAEVAREYLGGSDSE